MSFRVALSLVFAVALHLGCGGSDCEIRRSDPWLEVVSRDRAGAPHIVARAVPIQSYIDLEYVNRRAALKDPQGTIQMHPNIKAFEAVAHDTSKQAAEELAVKTCESRLQKIYNDGIVKPRNADDLKCQLEKSEPCD